MPRVKILNVIALAGGADKGAAAAAETRSRKHIPCGIVEKCIGFAAAEFLCIQLCKGKLCKARRNFPALRVYGFLIAVRKKLRNNRKHLFASLALGIKIKRIRRLIADDIALRVCSINAEGAAKTGLGGTRASHGENDPMRAAVLIIRIHRIRQKDAIQNIKAARIASADPEENEILALFAGINDLNLFSRDLEIHQVLGLGEEKVLCAAVCMQCRGKLGAAVPFLIFGAAVCINGNIKRICSGKRGKESIALGIFKLTHCAHLPQPLQPLPGRSL